MFFSNQLLCRKGPLGQIWIVATMQAKLNRKKADQINIEEICMQVLQPQVPLALRLSGILMGGIVLIFDRKVKFLYEDVNDFLFKLKTAVDAKACPDKHISLPRAKLHARFENVTLTYDFETIGDIERAMLHPGTPGQMENVDKEEYVHVIPTAVDPYAHLSSSGDKVSSDVPNQYQVSNDDITLEERNLSGSLHQQYEDFGMEFQEDRIPPSDNLFMDDFFPEIQVTVSSPPMQTNIDLDTKTAEHSEQQSNEQPDPNRRIPSQEGKQAVGPESPELGEVAATPQNKRMRRVRGARAVDAIFDQGFMEIPAPVFESWLRDNSDIRGRQFPLGKDPEAARAQRHLNLPSVCLLSPTCIQGLEPFWPAQLAKLWERTITGNIPPPTEEHMEDRQVEPSVPVRVSVQSSDPSYQIVEDNSSPRVEAENTAEIAGDLPSDSIQANFTSAQGNRGPGEIRDDGSVEKLRTALQSPSVGSDDFWGSQFGLTPGQQQVHVRSDRSRSTPGSVTLPLDIERDPPTGGSGRFKRPRLSGSFRSTSPRIFDNPSPGVDSVAYDFFSNQREGLQNPLSQFDLMEETQRDTSQDFIRLQVSAALIQYLRESFNQQGPRSIGLKSLFELSEGLRRGEAAKLFYQICVLASNHFLTVKQDTPYGDILLGRGIYL